MSRLVVLLFASETTKIIFDIEQMSALQIFGNILMRLKRFEQKGLGEYLIDLELQKEYPAKKIELKPSL